MTDLRVGSVVLPKSSGPRLPKSDLQVEIALRSGVLEIRSKGSISDLSKEISSISNFAKFAAEKLAGTSPNTFAEAASAAKEPSDVSEAPVIKVSTSTSANIRGLFETPWGKTPRSLDDIARALEVNAAPDSVQNIAAALIRLVKRGELRRIKKGGKWTYFRIPP